MFTVIIVANYWVSLPRRWIQRQCVAEGAEKCACYTHSDNRWNSGFPKSVWIFPRDTGYNSAAWDCPGTSPRRTKCTVRTRSTNNGPQHTDLDGNQDHRKHLLAKHMSANLMTRRAGLRSYPSRWYGMIWGSPFDMPWGATTSSIETNRNAELTVELIFYGEVACMSVAIVLRSSRRFHSVFPCVARS